MRVKDDDWRMSLMMGNYVTLTNVSDRELERIIQPPRLAAVHLRACRGIPICACGFFGRRGRATPAGAAQSG